MSKVASAIDSVRGRCILLTGATGRLGILLGRALLHSGARLRILTRSELKGRDAFPDSCVDISIGDLRCRNRVAAALDGVELVFHLASHSQKSNRGSIYDDPDHWAVTAEGTKNLAFCAVREQVKKIVYFSTVKAMGEAAGDEGVASDEMSPTRPVTLYGKAKLAAERVLNGVCERSHLEVSILRLPMVYGLGESGNLLRMIDAVARGRFPPFPEIENRRSAVHALDVVDAALLVATSHKAGNKTYLVTDGEYYSTRWIYERIHDCLELKPPHWTLPLWCWQAAAGVGTTVQRATGRSMPISNEALQKLTGNAWYSSGRISQELGFTPSRHLNTSLDDMVDEYRNRQFGTD